jgi:hypothetical protein
MFHAAKHLPPLVLAACLLQSVCQGAEVGEIIAISEAHFRQLGCLEIEATFWSRDLTEQQSLEAWRKTFRKAADGLRQRAEQSGKQTDIENAKSYEESCESNAVGCYLNEFSVRESHLFFDQGSDRSLTTYRLDWDTQERRAVALGLAEETARQGNLLRQVVVLREGNRRLDVKDRGPEEGKRKPLVSLSSSSEGSQSVFNNFSLEPILRLGLLPNDKMRDIPLVFVKMSKEEMDDLVVVSFEPRTRAKGGASFRFVVKCRPSLGFRIVEQTLVANGTVFEKETFDYKPWEGRIFLKEYHKSYYNEDGKGTKEEHITVNRVTFHESIPDEEFTVRIPASIMIEDRSSGGYVRISGDSEGHRRVSTQDVLREILDAAMGKVRKESFDEGF